MKKTVKTFVFRSSGRNLVSDARAQGCFFIIPLMMFLLAAPSSFAANVSMTANDANGPVTSFNGAGKWSDGNPPSSGNDYFSSTFYIRTPATSASTPQTYIFGGHSLTLQAYASANGRSMIFKGTNGDALLIDNFTNAAGAMINEGSGTYGFTIGGNLWTIAGNSTLATDQGGPITVNSPLAGSAIFTNSGSSTITYNGTNSAFTGALVVSGGTVVFNSTSNILGNPASLTPDQYTLGASTTLKDNVGVTLNAPNSGVTLTGAATINTAAAGSNTVIFVPITGAFSLTKSGAGTLTLSGANDFSGGLTFTAGQLNINSATALGTGTLNINGGTNIDNTSGGAIVNANNNAITISQSFTFAGSSDLDLGTGSVNNGSLAKTITVAAGKLTIGGQIYNAGSLTKAGNGTLVFGSYNTYGNTTISGGTLALVGSAGLSSTNIAIGTNATLDVSGLSGGTLALNYGQVIAGNGAINGTLDCGSGTIAPGASAGTLTVTNLTLSGSGNLNFDLANVTTVGGGTNDYMIVPGTLTIGGSTTLNLNFLNGAPASTGKYTLVSYGSYSGPAGDISSYFSVPTGFTVTNDTTTKTIDLLINHVPANILWVGNNGGTWDVAGTMNWNSTDGYFYNGDSPRFDDTATTTGSINVSTPVSCGTLTVSNSAGYDFTGGAITAASLTKQSSGTLTLENDVTIGAGTLIGGGTLQIGNGGSTGTLTSGGVTNNGSLVFNRDATTDLAIAAPISGSGDVTQMGTGSTALSGSNSYTGFTTISAGRINVANGSALGTVDAGTAVSNAAALYIIQNVDFAEDIELNGSGLNSDGSGALRKGGAGASTWSGSVTLGSDSTIGVDGGASLTLGSGINGSTFALTKSGGGALTLNANSTLTGGFTLSAGTLNIMTSQAMGQAPGMITINGGTIANLSGAPLTLGQNQDMVWGGSWTFAGTNDLNLGTGAVTLNSNETVTVNNSGLTVGGSISGAGGFTLEGTGTLLLTGSNAFSGGLLLDNGTQGPATVRLSNNNAAGTGTISYNGGGNNTSGRLELIGGITVTNPLSLSGRNVNANAIENISGNNELSGTLSIFSGGTQYLIQSDAGTLTFSGATGDGIAMTVSSGSRTFTLRGAGDGVVSGVVTNGGGTAAVTKDGTGTWTLSGANTYTGATTISTGTLLVNGSLDSGSAVTVNGGTLGGTGTIGGTVAVNSGATLAPGASIGTLTINGALTLASGSTNTFEVNGSTPTNDVILLGGAVTYGGVLNIVPSGSFTVGQTFTLFSGAGATSGFNFDSIQGSPGSGKAFSFTNGVLSVVSSAPTSEPIQTSYNASTHQLVLSWAQAGWTLESQTNNLGTGLKTSGWTPVTGATSPFTNTVDPSQGAVFYRLKN